MDELASKVWGRAKGCASAARKYVTLAACILATVAGGAHASTVTLPDTGANISGLVTAGITAIGAIVALIVGGYFAFLVIRLAMKWARRIA